MVFFNAAIPIVGELLDAISGVEPSSEGGAASSEAISAKIWNNAERDSFISFQDEVARRQAEQDDSHKRLGHNWIALSVNHYERQIPLINSLLKGDESKESKLKVSSRVRRQYYPAGWTIVHVLFCWLRETTLPVISWWSMKERWKLMVKLSQRASFSTEKVSGEMPLQWKWWQIHLWQFGQSEPRIFKSWEPSQPKLTVHFPLDYDDNK